MKVPYSYLDLEYKHWETSATSLILQMKDSISKGWFTMGPHIQEFEKAIASDTGYRYAVAVGSGTDALCLALKAHGIGPGWSVYTPTNTFMASVGAILMTGATAKLTDVGDDYLMELPSLPSDEYRIAMLPVELTGRPFPSTAQFGGWSVIMDSAQSIGSGDGYRPYTRCLSLHPLKNVHVWGDGGVVLTDSGAVDGEVRLLRNHGSPDRDTVLLPGHNSRLDNLQAQVGLWSLSHLDWVTSRRNSNASFYDEHLSGISGVTLPSRDPGILEAFHTYVIQVDRRQELQWYLSGLGIETKIHYPTPLHLQPGFRHLGYKRGDFPVAEHQAMRILSLPIHEYLEHEHLEYVADAIKGFYAGVRESSTRSSSLSVGGPR